MGEGGGSVDLPKSLTNSSIYDRKVIDNFNSMTIPLVGKDLLDKIKSLGDVSKSELARGCGYYVVDAAGVEKINYTAFFSAILDAKGVSLGESEEKEASRTDAIPVEWTELNEYEIARRIPQASLLDTQVEEFSRSDIPEIRAAVAMREDLPQSVIQRLSEDGNDIVSAVIRERELDQPLKDILWIQLRDNFSRGLEKLTSLLCSGEISDHCIEILAQSPICEVRLAVARHENTPNHILLRLSEDRIGRDSEYNEVRAAVRERLLPEEWKRLIWFDYNSQTVDERISNEIHDESVLDILSQSCNTNIRSAVARSKYLTSSIYKRLLEDGNLDVKISAIKGPKKNPDSNGVCFKGTLTEFIATCDELYYESPCAVVDSENNIITFTLQAGRTSSLGEAILRFSGSSDDVPQDILDEIREELDDDTKHEDIERIVCDGIQDWLEEQISEGDCIDNDYFSYNVLFFELDADKDESQYYAVSDDVLDKITGWEISWKRNVDLTISLKLPSPLEIDQVIDFSKLELLSLEVGDADPTDDDVYFSLSPLAIKNIITRIVP